MLTMGTVEAAALPLSAAGGLPPKRPCSLAEGGEVPLVVSTSNGDSTAGAASESVCELGAAPSVVRSSPSNEGVDPEGGGPSSVGVASMPATIAGAAPKSASKQPTEGGGSPIKSPNGASTLPPPAAAPSVAVSPPAASPIVDRPIVSPDRRRRQHTLVS